MNRHLRTYRLVFATAIFATAIALTGIGRADSSEQFELREATIADIQAAYRDGILSPQHLVSMYLARIAVLDRSNLPQPVAWILTIAWTATTTAHARSSGSP